MAKPLAVLIVEDMESDAQLIARLLTKAGYAIAFERVETVEQMRAALEKQAWEIVISDFRMPELDGYGALNLLQETGLDIPFIVVSGTMGEETAVEMMKAGAHDYVMKGNLPRLIPAVERELIQAEVRRERQRAQETLRESEIKFRQTFDISPVGIVMVGLDKRFIRCNPAFAQYLGYGTEELVGKLIGDVTLPEDSHIGMAEMMAIMKGEIAQAQVHKRYLRKDGQVVWGEVTISLIRDSEGRAQYFLAIIQDVTRRKQAEDALRESEDKFKYVFEHASVGKSITLPTGEISVNQAMCDMLGYSQEEIKTRKWQEISHPEDLELTQNWINALLAGEKESARFNKRYLHKNGSVVWADISTALRRDKDGQPLYFMTTINDITARKQAEDALRASEERFALVIDASEQGIWDWNVETNEVFYSEQWKKQIGYQDNELKNDFNTWVEHLHPDESEDCQKAVYSYLNQPVEHFVLEFRFRHKDGSYRWIHNKASSLKNNEGKVIRMFGAHTDITERVQAEQTLKEYSARLEADVAERTRELRDTQEQLIRHEKLAVLGQLAGGVGHELRNPLAVILNAVYYLNLVQPEASEKIRQYHGMIEYEAHNAEKIITDLLDFARIKSVDREPVAVPELARRALERFPAPESVAVTFDFSPGLPKVFVDPRQVEQVLGNLVVNACQAMKDGGKLSVISEQCSVDGVPWVRIAVKDTGTGILPENMQKLFEPLFTTKAKGIGLGLAISQKLVEANGGKIEVQSEPGVGSTFTLYLPVLDK